MIGETNGQANQGRKGSRTCKETMYYLANLDASIEKEPPPDRMGHDEPCSINPITQRQENSHPPPPPKAFLPKPTCINTHPFLYTPLITSTKPFQPQNPYPIKPTSQPISYALEVSIHLTNNLPYELTTQYGISG